MFQMTEAKNTQWISSDQTAGLHEKNFQTSEYFEVGKKEVALLLKFEQLFTSLSQSGISHPFSTQETAKSFVSQFYQYFHKSPLISLSQISQIAKEALHDIHLHFLFLESTAAIQNQVSRLKDQALRQEIATVYLQMVEKQYLKYYHLMKESFEAFSQISRLLPQVEKNLVIHLADCVERIMDFEDLSIDISDESNVNQLKILIKKAGHEIGYISERVNGILTIPIRAHVDNRQIATADQTLEKSLTEISVIQANNQKTSISRIIRSLFDKIIPKE